jgi:hypothetical protein
LPKSGAVVTDISCDKKCPDLPQGDRFPLLGYGRIQSDEIFAINLKIVEYVI